jgi:hypothetical protein
MKRSSSCAARLRRRALCALAIALGVIGSLDSVDAQVSDRSLYLWGGIGYGSFGCYQSFNCNAHESGEARGAKNVFAGIGWTLTPLLIGGLELNARSKNQGESTLRLISASTVLLLYPVRSLGLHMKGSLGLGSLNHSGTEGDIILSDDWSTGPTATVGIGYDISLSPRLALSPGLDIGGASFGQDYRRLWESRIRLTWHWSN